MCVYIINTEFKKAFKLLDKNGDGDISCKELKKSLHALGQNPTNAEVKKIIKAVDTDGKSRKGVMIKNIFGDNPCGWVISNDYVSMECRGSGGFSVD